MSIIDSKRRVIPQCNVNNEDDNIFVKNVANYTTSVRQISFAKNASLISLAVLIIVLSIFTLNFGSSGWTIGNALTFVISMLALIGTGYFARAWNKHYTLLSTMRQDGVPCKIPEADNTQVIYCGLQPQTGNITGIFTDLFS